MFLAAAVQLSCGSDPAANWESARILIERAAGYGAELIATPENTDFLGPPDEKVRQAETLDGRLCSRFAALAAEVGRHLLLGSFAEKSDDSKRCFNTSVLFGPDGQRLAVYRKIHLFDVDLSEKVRFTESDRVKPGDQAVVVPTAVGKLGLTICFDLRFSGLYRTLADRGAEVIAVPSAFTLTTGKDHWEPLIRSRAIETQSYVLAPAQFGKHDDRGIRESYGHSMIVDPWGHVAARCSDGPGLALAEIDLKRVAEVRRAMPMDGGVRT